MPKAAYTNTCQRLLVIIYQYGKIFMIRLQVSSCNIYVFFFFFKSVSIKQALHWWPRAEKSPAPLESVPTAGQLQLSKAPQQLLVSLPNESHSHPWNRWAFLTWKRKGRCLRGRATLNKTWGKSSQLSRAISFHPQTGGPGFGHQGWKSTYWIPQFKWQSHSYRNNLREHS